MMRGEATLVLILSLLGITTQSPYSHQSEYSSHSGYPARESSKDVYGSSRFRSDRYNNDEMDRAESRHTRHRPDHRDALIHHPLADHKSSSRDDHIDHPFIHRPNYELNIRSHEDRRDLEDPFRNKRQAFLPYFPYFSYVPPIYQVHNIYLTPPGYNCYPARPGVPERPPKTPETTPEPGLDMRFGNSDNSTEPAKQEPSKCVWSIVACCSPGSRDIRYACFELLGCPGAFWDVNPCDERVVAAAANSALKYYMNNQAPTPEPSFQNL